MKNRAEFVADCSFPDMLYAVTVRSPVASGVLSAIVCPELPDSCYLVTAKQIPGKNELADFPVPVLADKQLSYIGEPVALLAGPEELRLKELAARITVIAEPAEAETAGEVLVKREIVWGEPEKVFQECEKVAGGIYVTGIQAHCYPEPHGALALAGEGEGPAALMTIRTATQWPYHVGRSVEQVLGWESGSVIVSPAVAATPLDGKLWYPSLVACHAALAAFVAGKPVKLMLTGEEDFLYAPKRNRAEIELRSALGEKGEILASMIRLSLDLGAQGVFKEEIMDHTCLGSLGFYHRPASRIDGVGLRTGIPVQGPLAGFGLSQGFFAAERHASHIAEALGQDPAEWRKSNFLKEKQTLAIGTHLKHSAPLPELIDAAAASSDYYRKWASYELLRNSRRGKSRDFTAESLRGIGIATAFQGSGFLYSGEGGNCTVEMRLEKDGSLEIKTSLSGSGPESGPEAPPELWRNLAQEILGVEDIRFVNATRDAPDSGAATLSRTICVVTRLVEKCCMAIRNQRFRRPLPITIKRSFKSVKEAGWGARNIESEAFARPAWGAAVAEIEIDPVSLSPVIRGIWLAVDGGRILSPRRARSALTTATIQALGWTCREQLFYESGKIPLELYRAYDLIAPAEIPAIHIDFMRNDTAAARGLGDLPFCCVPAAYVQAVSQAMDHHFTAIPLGVREIWEAAKQYGASA